MALQTIVSRSCHSKENAVVTVAAVSAGTANNIIPDKAVLQVQPPAAGPGCVDGADTCCTPVHCELRHQGTIRDLSPTVSELINRRLHTIVHSTCEAMGCKAEVRPSRHARECMFC